MKTKSTPSIEVLEQSINFQKSILKQYNEEVKVAKLQWENAPRNANPFTNTVERKHAEKVMVALMDFRSKVVSELARQEALLISIR